MKENHNQRKEGNAISVVYQVYSYAGSGSAYRCRAPLKKDATQITTIEIYVHTTLDVHSALSEGWSLEEIHTSLDWFVFGGKQKRYPVHNIGSVYRCRAPLEKDATQITSNEKCMLR